MSWREQAACDGADLARFFPPERAVDRLVIAGEAAREFCAGCPSLQACGSEADLHRDAGLRGGVYRLGGTNSYRRLPLLPGLELAPMPERLPGIHTTAGKWAS